MRFKGLVMLAVAASMLPSGVSARPATSAFTVELQFSLDTDQYTLEAHTRIGAECLLSGEYEDSSITFQIGTQQHVGPSGIVRWIWKPLHTATVAVACTWKGVIVAGMGSVAVSGSSAAHTSTQKPAAPPPAGYPRLGSGHVILTWHGKQTGKGFLESSNTFTVRGPFYAWIKVWPVDSAKVASADGANIYNTVTFDFDTLGPQPLPGPIAIDLNGAPVTYQNRITDNKCQFGCTFNLASASNLQWMAVIEQ